jgi:hypothetical protein
MDLVPYLLTVSPDKISLVLATSCKVEGKDWADLRNFCGILLSATEPLALRLA